MAKDGKEIVFCAKCNRVLYKSDAKQLGDKFYDPEHAPGSATDTPVDSEPEVVAETETVDDPVDDPVDDLVTPDEPTTGYQSQGNQRRKNK